ncbi:hypothetical protein BASA61_000118 [Batrachochytrium salamandrivorans]|nr:hypothetical protein BASA61_000118 [Batrachochytrium salamandrivorans]
MYNTETRQVKLIDFDVSAILPGWEGGKSVPLKSLDPPSPVSGYKAGYDELQGMQKLGKLLDSIVPAEDTQLDYSSDEQAISRTMPAESDSYKSKLKEKAMSLIAALDSSNPKPMSSIEAILNDPFFG